MRITHILLALVLIISIIGCGKAPEDNIVGSDRDEHGCIGSAGYIWCEAKQKCLRTWEEPCEEEESTEDSPTDTDDSNDSLEGQTSDSEESDSSSNEITDLDADLKDMEETMTEIESLDSELASLDEDINLDI
jgi:hypothetical protein